MDCETEAKSARIPSRRQEYFFDIPCFVSKFRVDVKMGRMMETVELVQQVNPDHLTPYQKRKLQWVLDHAAKMKTPDAPKQN